MNPHINVNLGGNLFLVELFRGAVQISGPKFYGGTQIRSTNLRGGYSFFTGLAGLTRVILTCI